ncbi:MAG: cytochrome b/b6 domain-containing protein [Gammaproteobacteria bacterium]|nr:cytochrome b/b6 domain-containing protein [Gammaproteobacteria bacterium]
MRYHAAQIALHWSMAILFIAMLAMGLWMTSLPEDDLSRYQLTQIHKAVGITLIALVLLRILTALTLARPAPPAELSPKEQTLAHLGHIALYIIMLLMPLSGWLMINSSTLGITSLGPFGISIPKLTVTGVLADETLWHQLHYVLGLASAALVAGHIGAALWHQLHQRIALLQRLHHRGAILAALAITGLVVWSVLPKPAAEPIASEGSVGFTAYVMGAPVKGQFAEVDTALTLNGDGSGQLTMSLQIDSLGMSDQQIATSIRESEWFDAAQYPQASFVSTSVWVSENGITAQGDLTIKGRSVAVEIDLLGDSEKGYQGSVSVDRRAFDIGMTSQPGDSTVGYEVDITVSIAPLNQG